MDFPHAIAIIVARILAPGMTDGSMRPSRGLDLVTSQKPLATPCPTAPTCGIQYSLPNSYPHMRMNQISIFLSNLHKGILKIFDLIEESHHESGVDV
jgi:hypothetical protein